MGLRQLQSEVAPEAVGSVVGHNRPPVDQMARQDFDEAIDQKAGFRARVGDLEASAGRATCTNNEEAGRCAELIRQIRAAEKFVEDTHREVKAPYLLAGRAVDDAKNNLIAPLSEARQTVQRALNQWQADVERIQREEARRRIEAEEARQREEEARLRAQGVPEEAIEEEVAPAAPVEPERVVVRGDYGATLSGRKEWTFAIEDYHTALLEVADNAKVREAVEKTIAGLVRSGERAINGVRIFQQVKAVVR